MTEKILQRFSEDEKVIQTQLDTLQTAKKDLERLTEEVMDRAGEAVYHLHQVFQLDISARDYARATDLLGNLQGSIRGVEADLDERREELLSHERKLTEQIDDLHYQKKLAMLREEEHNRKETRNGQS